MVTNYVVHVGVIIKEDLQAIGLSQKQLSDKTGISTTIINEIIKGKRKINADYASKFSEVFMLPPTYWLEIQNQYDLACNDDNIKKIVTNDINANLVELGYDANVIADRLICYENEDKIKNQLYEKSLTPLKLQKILYFVQKKFISLGKILFNDCIYNWQYGPVVKSVYDRFKGQKNPIDIEVVDKPIDSESEKILLYEYNKYKKYTASYLVDLSHKEKSWQVTNNSQIITPQIILQYL